MIGIKEANIKHKKELIFAELCTCAVGFKNTGLTLMNVEISKQATCKFSMVC